jgi:hypothetical protein
MSSSADAMQSPLRSEKSSSATEACDRHSGRTIMEQQGSLRSDARVNSWPPDLTETLPQQSTGVRRTGVRGAVPSIPWLQSFMSGGLRSTGGAAPTLMSTGMLFTVRDDAALTQWLILDGNSEGDDGENERGVGVLGEMHTDSFGTFARKTALLSNNDPERCALARQRGHPALGS